MILTVLGSGGSEGCPSPFCTCKMCEHARRFPDSHEYRRRTAYLVDDDTLIDIGPDFREQMRLNHIDYAKIKRIVLTHSHGDHLDLDVFCRRISPKFAVNPPWIDFYSDEAGIRAVGGPEGKAFPLYSVNPYPIHPGETRITPDVSMEINAVRATHDPGTTPLNYVLTRGGKTLLIANDTGWWCDESWEQIARFGHRFDCAVIDCSWFSDMPDACEKQPHFGMNGMLRFRDR